MHWVTGWWWSNDVLYTLIAGGHNKCYDIGGALLSRFVFVLEITVIMHTNMKYIYIYIYISKWRHEHTERNGSDSAATRQHREYIHSMTRVQNSP